MKYRYLRLLERWAGPNPRDVVDVLAQHPLSAALPLRFQVDGGLGCVHSRCLQSANCTLCLKGMAKRSQWCFGGDKWMKQMISMLGVVVGVEGSNG